MKALIGAIGVVALLVMAHPAQAQSSPIKFAPEITIPTFTEGGSVTVDAQTIAKYIKAVFVYFIWTVGILAVVMITYGGIRWVAAAGNPGRINDARDIINNALIGLIIALTSVVLLNIINPNLTNFQGITISSVPTIQYETDSALGENGEGASGRACTTKGGNPIRIELDCAAKTEMGWPVGNISAKKVTSRVGSRDVKVGSACHPGTDFSTDKVAGKPVLAVVDGTITSIGAGCGEAIVNLDAGTYHVRYVHVHSTSVTVGQKVHRGDTIGLSGGDPKTSSAVAACSGAPHVHVELYTSNGELHDIDPCVEAFVEHPIPGGQSQF